MTVQRDELKLHRRLHTYDNNPDCQYCRENKRIAGATQDEPGLRIIDITPEVLKTLAGAARVNQAVKEFEDASADVANNAISFLDNWADEIAAIGNREMIEELNDLNSAIENRRRKQEAFLRAMANQPPQTAASADHEASGHPRY